MRHIIRQQHLHVELNGTESDGLALQRRLPGLCRDWLIPALERTLDRFAPPEGSLYIERLEIDAGVMSLNNLEHNLADAVTQAFEKVLREQIAADGMTAAADCSRKTRHKTVQQSVSEAFFFFLEIGQLPWSFRLPEGKTLEQAVLDVWQKPIQASGNIRSADTSLRHVLASVATRKRLTRQFTPLFLQTLLAMLAPEGAMMLDRILEVLRSGNMSSAEIRQVERLVWESAFAKAVTGSFLTAEEIVSDVAVEHSAAAEVLVRHWPLAAVNTPSVARTLPEQSDREISDAEKLKNFRLLNRYPAVEADMCVRPYLPEQRDKSFRVSEPTQPVSLDNTHAIRQELTESAQFSAHAFLPDNRRQSAADKAISDSAQSALSSSDNTSFMTPAVQKSTSFCQQLTMKHEQLTVEEKTSASAFRSKNALVMQSKPPPAPHPPLAASSVNLTASRKLPDLTEGIYINNAGLVLLHPFLPQFFSKLSIVADKQLLQPERALCLLHFLATGQPVAPEFELMLPKVLCNIPLEEPVEADADLTVAEQDEAVALLSAAIRHWEALRNTSPDALRGTFLVRPGKISLRGGDWLLQVEPQTWDILLEQLPWGIGMIKLPWMDRLLHVEWN